MLRGMPATPSEAEWIASATHFDGVALAAQVAFASQRAPLRSEVMVVAVTTASVAYNTPNGSIAGQPSWLNRFVVVQAHGGDVLIQFALGTDAAMDDAAVSTVPSIVRRWRPTP